VRRRDFVRFVHFTGDHRLLARWLQDRDHLAPCTLESRPLDGEEVHTRMDIETGDVVIFAASMWLVGSRPGASPRDRQLRFSASFSADRFIHGRQCSSWRERHDENTTGRETMLRGSTAVGDRRIACLGGNPQPVAGLALPCR
jgi:hypothetical protein